MARGLAGSVGIDRSNVVARNAPAPARTYGCDAAGNVTHGNELSAVYDFQNLPRRVQRTGSPHPGSTAFRYAATGARYEEVTGSGVTTRLGVRGYEKVSGAGVVSSPRHRHELGPVIVTRAGANEEVVYVTRDRLGSLVGVLPNNPYKGLLKSYDAFGKPREGNFKDNGKTPEAGRLLLGTLTERGFTGHGHIDEGRVIHMNGRIYDYALGRFLGVDPIIQFPSNSQSLNPYSYILNNPLAGTDPSGYMSRIGRYMLSRIHAQTSSCMGVGHCQEYSDKMFLMGATAGLRAGLTAGGVPPGKGPRNGADLANRIAKAFSTDADEIGAVAARIDGAAFANGAVTAAFSYAFGQMARRGRGELGYDARKTSAGGVPYRTDAPEEFAELLNRYPEIGEKMDATMAASDRWGPNKEQGFYGYTPDSGSGPAKFVDMPQPVFRWDSLTFGHIPYMPPPAISGYSLDVVYHSHPFDVCFNRCMPGQAQMGPSPKDGLMTTVHPSAFHVIQQTGGHTYYYGPRALNGR